jgi:hypothetical protein
MAIGLTNSHKCFTEPSYLDQMGQFEYRVRVRLPGGRLLRTAPFFTSRPRGLGDLVRLPVRADGELHPGERFDWKVAAVENGGKLLVLEFLRAA